MNAGGLLDFGEVVVVQGVAFAEVAAGVELVVPGLRWIWVVRMGSIKAFPSEARTGNQMPQE